MVHWAPGESSSAPVIPALIYAPYKYRKRRRQLGDRPHMTALGALLALMLAFTAPAVSAQAAGEQAPADTATLVVVQRPIITFRATHLGRTPAARVAGAITRIRSAVRTGSLADPIEARPAEDGRLITYGGRPLFLVLPGDVDPLADQDLDAAAQEAVRQLEQARSEAIEQRSPGMLARSLG